jgi:prevent-host-death family protein
MKIMSVREFREKMTTVLGKEEVIVTKDGVPSARVMPIDPVERWQLLVADTRQRFGAAGVPDKEIEKAYRKARGKKS